MYSKLHHCWATVKVYFSLNELTYQSKKTDKQGSREMKNFHLINFDYIAIYDIYIFFQKSKKFVLF